MSRLIKAVMLGAAAIILALIAEEALAAPPWVVAPGPGRYVCETVRQKEPQPRLGPRGIEWTYEQPKCRQERTGLAPTFHLDADHMIPSQQTVPEGVPCVRILRRDHLVYGLTAQGGTLWALCTPANGALPR